MAAKQPLFKPSVEFVRIYEVHVSLINKKLALLQAGISVFFDSVRRVRGICGLGGYPCLQN